MVTSGRTRSARRALAAAFVLWAGHAHGLAAQSPSPAVASQATDSIWYVTNRAQSADGWRNLRDSTLHYGVRTFAVAPKPGEQFPWTGGVRKRVLADSALPPDAWSDRLTQSSLHGAAAALPVLVYLHGYGTSLREATEQAAELRRRGNFEGPVVVFSWPAAESGFARPTLDRPLTSAYWRDADRANESVPDLVLVLRDLTRTLGASRLVVAAHSMGGTVVDGALRDAVLSDALAVTPLRATAFLAPDVDATYFTDSLLVVARRTSSRQVLYGSRNDRMLQISSIIHGTARAGQLVQKTWPADLEVLDMTDARVAGNWWIRHLGTNHAFRRRPDAVSDFFGVVLRDVPAECRATSDVWVRESDRSWRLQGPASAADSDSAPRAPAISSNGTCPDAH